ncbi:hypothetical protein JB92DRAFT_2899230 [Gautieria morchelliformis]|nr:hypothetical protein JB92DRAFT_2899230 [Gautieria morchelliformis]
MISSIAITYITLDIVGGCSLLLLLYTYYAVKTLPQRNNPVLINIIFISYLATIPPLMLLFTGQQGGVHIQWICILQSALIDGIAPMYFVGLVALVFQTWSELRASNYNLAKSTWVQWTLLLAPYIAYTCWFVPSLTLALQPSARVLLYPFVYCTNDAHGYVIRNQVGYFVVACLAITIVLEVWTAYFVLSSHRRCRKLDLAHASSLYRTKLQLYVRLCTFTVMQVFPIIVTAVNYYHITPTTTAYMSRGATQIVESLYPLAVFFVFGTQRTVLQAWKILPATPVCKAEPRVPKI